MTHDGTTTKTALVTGANKGIGFEIAAGLARLGFRVAIGARDTGRRDEAVKRLRADGPDKQGGPDVLVNNAAITGGMPQDPSKVSADQILELATLPDGGPTDTFRDETGVQPRSRTHLRALARPAARRQVGAGAPPHHRSSVACVDSAASTPTGPRVRPSVSPVASTCGPSAESSRSRALRPRAPGRRS